MTGIALMLCKLKKFIARKTNEKIFYKINLNWDKFVACVLLIYFMLFIKLRQTQNSNKKICIFFSNLPVTVEES
jgi:hypothetical protein